MELRDYWRIIIQRGWIVVLAAVLTAGSAFLWSRSQTPEYRATAVVLVRADSLDFGRLQASKQILASFSQRIRSEEMAFTVVDRLQLDLNPYEVLANLAVSSDQNDLTIRIDATSNDPTVAGQLANGFAEEFIRIIEESNTVQLREDQVLVDLLQRAGVGAQTAPNTRINTIAGAVLGILLGGIIVLLFELLDDTIKTKEDVERYIGQDLFFLGQVPPSKG